MRSRACRRARHRSRAHRAGARREFDDRRDRPLSFASGFRQRNCRASVRQNFLRAGTSSLWHRL